MPSPTAIMQRWRVEVSGELQPVWTWARSQGIVSQYVVQVIEVPRLYRARPRHVISTIPVYGARHRRPAPPRTSRRLVRRAGIAGAVAGGREGRWQCGPPMVGRTTPSGSFRRRGSRRKSMRVRGSSGPRPRFGGEVDHRRYWRASEQGKGWPAVTGHGKQRQPERARGGDRHSTRAKVRKPRAAPPSEVCCSAEYAFRRPRTGRQITGRFPLRSRVIAISRCASQDGQGIAHDASRSAPIIGRRTRSGSYAGPPGTGRKSGRCFRSTRIRRKYRGVQAIPSR